MIGWTGLALKIWSWHLIGAQKKLGFIIGVFSNMALGWVAYEAGLLHVALAGVLTSFIQIKSWRKWE